MKRNTVIGILAHVDAGKTTLSEGLLYTSGMIRQMGRVDKQDAFLDTDAIERERGITIFSKQAVLKMQDTVITLLDTPGHVDFSAEMERTLQVLDYAILVISGADGVQGHTRTLWQLLKKYQIPVFLFLNKMDQSGTDANLLMKELKQQFSDSCVSFAETESEAFYEEAAMCSERALDAFLENGRIEKELLCSMIAERKLFPCFFGSALKLTGVEAFLQGIYNYTIPKIYPETFGAKVFKISRDESGNRLTHLKITGGELKVKTLLSNRKEGEEDTSDFWEEKVNQIRVYSGEKYESANEVIAGEICAVTGLTKTYPGQGLGIEAASEEPFLEPVLTYRILLPEGCDAAQMMPKLRQLEEEEPQLHLVWNEVHQEILVQVMGEVQTEILQRRILDRYGVQIAFDTGHILYKETIENTVEGVGHYEPLRHYAEVHLLLEPGERGSGLQCTADCSEDILDRNWQRLIITHLEEKEHIGVLTGSAVTDLKITLVTGRAHLKHTEGGDFRQATYRAVRQGLRQAKSLLLEPYYTYHLEVPENSVGRAMTDIEMRNGTIEGPKIQNGMAVLTGKAPVAQLQEYAKEVAAYTKGNGKLSLCYGGYERCHNTEEVKSRIGYDPEADLENPTGSVFCVHGAGYFVEWDKVPEYMHLESVLNQRTGEQAQPVKMESQGIREEEWLGVDEIDAILSRTFDANKRDKGLPKKGYKTTKRRIVADKADNTIYHGIRKDDRQEEYLLVDGYNIIHAWEDLRELSETNMDGARGKLQDILCDYQGIRNCQVIVVFDAYRVVGHPTEFFDYHNIHVVYTKEAETADAYIEKFAHENAKKYRIIVATSDGLEQIIIRGAGCLLLSARELQEEIRHARQQMTEDYMQHSAGGRTYLLDEVSDEVTEQIKALEQEREESE